MSVTESLTFIDKSTGLEVVVSKIADGAISLAIYSSAGASSRIAFGYANDGRATINEVPYLNTHDLWIGSTCFRLKWADLLKVADFLQLDIPQPELPAGQEVPR